MKGWINNTPAYAYLFVVLGFIYLPVIVLVIFSFQDGLLPVPPFNGPSLQWYEKMFENERLVDSLFNSIIVAVLSSLATTILGFLAAYGMSKHRYRFAGAIRFTLMAPLTVSYLIIGVGLLITLNLLGISKSLFAVVSGSCCDQSAALLCDNLFSVWGSYEKH